MLQADDGALWVSTNRGLAQMDERGRVEQTFGREDGLQGDEFNGGAFLRLADGRMVFGGGQGFNVFHPRSLHARAPAPPLAVTSLRVLGAPADVPRDIATRGLRLRHDENAVRFEFAALDFTAPQRNRFAYRLDGLDAEWTKAGTDRAAAYTNLAPGRYTLHVRAANSDGVWTEPGLAIPVVIRPAWWQTWGFRVVGGLLVLSGLILGVRGIAQRRLRAEVRRLELVRRVADERARISRDLHDHVGAQLSSVLAGVEIARLARARPDVTPLRDPLDAVEQDARETMRQLRETIWALHDESVTVGDFAARVEADLRSRVLGRERPVVRVDCRADPARVLGPAAALHLYRIVREAATNSLKHADASTLTVEMEDDDAGRLCVCVRDDGAFAGSSGDGALGASGFGVRSMRERASALGADFVLETDGGTAVRLRVPDDRLRAGVEP
jgi:signal transduction histidine kinase